MRIQIGNVRLIVFVAILVPLLSSCGNGSATISDQRLAGDWQGKSRFTGISYQEATQKKIAPQQVEMNLHIAADGTVTGRVGGATLSDGLVESNRGWLGRKLNIKTDFIIRGRLIGSVAAGSANETNTINAPFNLPNGRMKGTLFIIRPFVYPYPILSLQLNHPQ